MGLVDKLKNDVLNNLEDKIDEDHERARIKKQFNDLVDYIDEKKDLPGPDWMTAMFAKKVFSAGLDALADALDDGEVDGKPVEVEAEAAEETEE